MSLIAICTSLLLSTTLASSPPRVLPTPLEDSLSSPDTTEVLLTDQKIQQLTTFWKVLLQEPYNRRVIQASQTLVHATSYYQNQRTPKTYVTNFINLPLAAPHLTSLTSALASAQLTVPQVQALLWSWQKAFAKMNRDAFDRQVPDSAYVPYVGDTASILEKNVAFVFARGGLTFSTSGKALRPPLDLEGTRDTTKETIGLLNIYQLPQYQNSAANTTSGIDTAQLVCETTHPCDITIGVVWAWSKIVNGEKTVMSIGRPNVKVCVKNTTNCAVSDSNGLVKLTNLSPDNVVVTTQGDGLANQEVKFPLLYRHQTGAGIFVLRK